MKLRAHADDFGLTRHISENILACFDHGALDSTSLIVNGFDTKESVEMAHEQLKKGLQLHLHLNFMEGKPVSSSKEVPLLINSSGNFRHGFSHLWWRYLTGNQQTRLAFQHQIRHEIRAQILLFKQLLPAPTELIIDSHQHYHLIPFIGDELIRLHDDFPIRAIRLPREPFFLRPASSVSCGVHMGINMIKHSLLNHLSRKLLPKLERAGISHNQHFLGVLCTGNMSLKAIQHGLDKLSKTHNGEVEILFHPGGAAQTELSYWEDRPDLKRYYSSQNRTKEKSLLMSTPFRELLQTYRSSSERSA
ncbi:MAG: ChbG/HpnK family deacetylase [Bacteroidota bacterium]